MSPRKIKKVPDGPDAKLGVDRPLKPYKATVTAKLRQVCCYEIQAESREGAQEQAIFLYEHYNAGIVISEKNSIYATAIHTGPDGDDYPF